jgi:hypothetical protein
MEQLKVAKMSAEEWRAYSYTQQHRFCDRRDWCNWCVDMEAWRLLMNFQVAPRPVEQVVSRPLSPQERLERDMEEEPWKYGGCSSPQEEEMNEKWEEEELWAEVDRLECAWD